MDDAMTIREVVAATDVPAATLRAWERRYGFPVPLRTTGGHRRYSAADVAKIRRAHALVEDGWAAGSAVRHVLAEADNGGNATSPSGGTPTQSPTAGGPATMTATQTTATAATIVDVETPDHSPANTDTATNVDVEVAVLVSTTLRRLLRAESVEVVPAILAEVVLSLGGATVDAVAAPATALPLDVSMGVTDPVLVVAEPYTLARMRLESVLPPLLEDAQTVIDRLRSLRR